MGSFSEAALYQFMSFSFVIGNVPSFATKNEIVVLNVGCF